MNATRNDIEVLRAIAAGSAFPAVVENDLEERGFIIQTDKPYALLTSKGIEAISDAP